MLAVRADDAQVSRRQPDKQQRAAGKGRECPANRVQTADTQTGAQRAIRAAGKSGGAALQTSRRTTRDGQGGALTGERARQWARRRTKSLSAHKEQRRDSQSKAEAKARAKNKKAKSKNKSSRWPKVYSRLIGTVQNVCTCRTCGVLTPCS